MANSPSSRLAAHWLWEDPLQGPSRGCAEGRQPGALGQGWRGGGLAGARTHLRASRGHGSVTRGCAVMSPPQPSVLLLQDAGWVGSLRAGERGRDGL